MKLTLRTEEKNLLSHLVVGGFIIGALLTTFIFFLSFGIFNDFYLDQNNFIDFHRIYPTAYILWALPFALAILARTFGKLYLKRKVETEKIIEEKNATITQNALFSKIIGEGDFNSISMNKLNDNDLLTKSLLIMRKNLIKTSEKESSEKWINEGREIISDELRKNRSFTDMPINLLKVILDYTGLIQGSFFVFDEEDGKLKCVATYAYNRRKFVSQEFAIGQGLIGAAAFEKQSIYRTQLPEDYATITSGLLGDKKPGSLLIVPLMSEEKVQGVIEVADINDQIESKAMELLEIAGPIIGQILFNLKVNIRTEKLLAEAQMLTEELRENEEELQQNAEEMRMTHEELEKTNLELERQFKKVETAKSRLHSLLLNASEVISVFDEKGKVIYESPSTEKIFGYKQEDVIGTQGLKRVAPEHVNLIKENFVYLINNPFKTVRYSFKYIHKEGHEIWVEAFGRNMLKNDAIQGIIYNIRDITLQRNAERDRLMKSQMQALSENSPDMIMRLSTQRNFLYINPQSEKYIGISIANDSEKNIFETTLEEDIKSIIDSYISEVMASSIIKEGEFEIHGPSGSLIINLTAIPEFNDEKELDSVLIIGHDLTNIKQIEREIKDKNMKLTESINYAQRIQSSILPNYAQLKSQFSDAFIYYKPRDVVSGDFPWFKMKDEYIFLAAVDCTGHGVPGALLSFIGYFLLNDIVNLYANKSVNEILEIFDEEVKATLQQKGSSRDGMDIALIKLNKKTMTMEYSGAHRPLYMLRNGELSIYKGDRRSIGGLYGTKKIADFTAHVLQLQKNDRLFIFSDGLPDQFSNEFKEKYQARRIRENIIQTSSVGMLQVEDFFHNDFEQWKGDYRQIDDILLIGIEI